MAVVRSEGLHQRKIPMTPSGIEPATFRFAAQHLNKCTWSPFFLLYQSLFLSFSKFQIENMLTHFSHLCYAYIYAVISLQSCSILQSETTYIFPLIFLGYPTSSFYYLTRIFQIRPTCR